MICLCPQRSWKRGHGTEGVWRCGSGKNQKSPSWASSRSYPAIPSPTFNISVYISACEPFEYVCILNLPRLCFSSLLKGHGGRGWSGNSRIRRMNTTLLIGYLCGNLIKYANSPFFVLRTQSGRRDETLCQRLSVPSSGQDSGGLKCGRRCQLKSFGIN